MRRTWPAVGLLLATSLPLSGCSNDELPSVPRGAGADAAGGVPVVAHPAAADPAAKRKGLPGTVRLRPAD